MGYNIYRHSLMPMLFWSRLTNFHTHLAAKEQYRLPQGLKHGQGGVVTVVVAVVVAVMVAVAVAVVALSQRHR